MNMFWNWAVKNLSNIFNLIGIALTFYFGVFYVPSYLREAQQEKSVNAQRNLQQSIKELIYSDSICTPEEIVALIEAKEIELGQRYPYTIKQLLTQIQDSFMQDRFLPFQERRKLITELESLKRQVTEVTSSDGQIDDSMAVFWIGLLSAGGTIIFVFIAIRSWFLKFRADKEKDEEIENQIVSSDIPSSNDATRYENEIVNSIRQYPGVEIFRRPTTERTGFDLEFTFDRRVYLVEVKYLSRSKVGLTSFHAFLNYQLGLEGEFWFVYNTDVTEMVRRKAHQMNQLTGAGRQIVLIHAENGRDLARQLPNLLRG